MQAVGDGSLWIGNTTDLRKPAALYEAGVAAVVDLAYEAAPTVLPRDLIYARFPLIDGEGNERHLLQAAIQTVAMLLRLKIPMLVACGAGMSRSPAVAAVATACVFGGSPEVRLAELATEIAHDVSPAFWHELREAMRGL